MIARVVKYHSIADWDFSLWFALQGSLADAAAVSLDLREFAFAPGANAAKISEFFTNSRRLNPRIMIVSLSSFRLRS